MVAWTARASGPPECVRCATHCCWPIWTGQTPERVQCAILVYIFCVSSPCCSFALLCALLSCFCTPSAHLSAVVDGCCCRPPLIGLCSAGVVVSPLVSRCSVPALLFNAWRTLWRCPSFPCSSLCFLVAVPLLAVRRGWSPPDAAAFPYFVFHRRCHPAACFPLCSLCFLVSARLWAACQRLLLHPAPPSPTRGLCFRGGVALLLLFPYSLYAFCCCAPFGRSSAVVAACCCPAPPPAWLCPADIVALLFVSLVLCLLSCLCTPVGRASAVGATCCSTPPLGLCFTAVVALSLFFSYSTSVFWFLRPRGTFLVDFLPGTTAFPWFVLLRTCLPFFPLCSVVSEHLWAVCRRLVPPAAPPPSGFCFEGVVALAFVVLLLFSLGRFISVCLLG